MGKLIFMQDWDASRQVAKLLLQAIWLHGLPSGRGWTNAVWDMLRCVVTEEIVDLAAEDPRAAYYEVARACGEDPEA